MLSNPHAERVGHLSHRRALLPPSLPLSVFCPLTGTNLVAVKVRPADRLDQSEHPVDERQRGKTNNQNDDLLPRHSRNTRYDHDVIHTPTTPHCGCGCLVDMLGTRSRRRWRRDGQTPHGALSGCTTETVVGRSPPSGAVAKRRGNHVLGSLTTF